MRFTVTLTLELETQDIAERDKYVDSATGEATLDYLADLFDEETLENATTYPETKLVSINHKTQEEVRISLATRVP